MSKLRNELRNFAVFFCNRLYRGLPFDKEAFENHIAALGVKLDVYDKILSRQKYMTGNVCVFA